MSSQSGNRQTLPPQFAPVSSSSSGPKQDRSQRSDTQASAQQRGGKSGARQGTRNRDRDTSGAVTNNGASSLSAGICTCGCGQWLPLDQHHKKTPAPKAGTRGSRTDTAVSLAVAAPAASASAEAGSAPATPQPASDAATAPRGGRAGHGAARGGSAQAERTRDGTSSLIGALLTANVDRTDTTSTRGRGRGRGTSDRDAQPRTPVDKSAAASADQPLPSPAASASETLLRTFGSGLPPRTAALISSLGGAPQCAICVGEIGLDEQVWACDGCFELTHYECVKQWAGASATNKKPDTRAGTTATPTDGAVVLETRRGALEATLQMFRAQRASDRAHAASFAEREGVVSVREDAAVEEVLELSHGKFTGNVQKLLTSAAALTEGRSGMLGTGDDEGFFGEEVDAALLDRPAAELLGEPFACPACMLQHAGLPAVPRCFCGRLPWPHYKPGVLPHSCGDTCGKPRAAGARVDAAAALQELPALQPLLPTGAAASADDLSLALRELLRQQQQQQGLIPLALDAPLTDKISSVSHPLFRTMPYTCPHPCSLPCHPGPCPPCAAHALAVTCACGRGKATLACASMGQATIALAMDVFRTDKHAGALSCGRVCGKLLGARRDAVEPVVADAAQQWQPAACTHECKAHCHIGPCPPCSLAQTATCLCGKHTEARACGEYGFVALAAYIRDCGVAEADVDAACVTKINGKSCVRVFTCAETCDRPLACGKHHCVQSCHAGPCAPCRHSPAPEELCPCEHTLFLYDRVASDPAPAVAVPEGAAHATVQGRQVAVVRVPGRNPRTDCAAPLRTCEHQCGRTSASAAAPARLLQQGLPHSGCTHPCVAQCHSGACPPCTAANSLPCRCGKQEVAVPCQLASLADSLLHATPLRVQGRTVSTTVRGNVLTLPLAAVSPLYAEMPQHVPGPLPGTNVDDAATVWVLPSAALPHMPLTADSAPATTTPPALGSGWFMLSPQGHFMRGDIALALSCGMVTTDGRCAKYLAARDQPPAQVEVGGRVLPNPYQTLDTRALRGFTELLSTLLTLCTKRCRRVLSCGLHNCLTLCCPAPGHPHASPLSHVCAATCAKYLSCGHKCSKPCHSGTCGSCELVLPGAACECAACITARPGDRRPARVRCGDGTAAQCQAQCPAQCSRGAAAARVASYVMSAPQAMQLAAADATNAHTAVQYGAGAQALMVAPALLSVHALALLGKRPQALKLDEDSVARVGNLTVVRAPDPLFRNASALRGLETVFKAMPALLTAQSLIGKVASRLVQGDALAGAALVQLKLTYAHLLVCEDEAGRVVNMVEWQRSRAAAAGAGADAVAHVSNAVTYSGRSGGANTSAEQELLPIDMAVFDRARFPPGVSHVILSRFWNGMRQHQHDNRTPGGAAPLDGPAAAFADALAPPTLITTSMHPPLTKAHCNYTYALADSNADAAAPTRAPAKPARVTSRLPLRAAGAPITALPDAYAALPPNQALLLAYPAPILAATAAASLDRVALFPPAGALPDPSMPAAAADGPTPAVALYVPPGKPVNLQPLFPPLLLLTGAQPVCLHNCPHKCHSGSCPPCSVLAPRLCSCGATVMPNVRCSAAAVQCGRECGKLLPCRRHKCVRLCHTGACGEATSNSSPTATAPTTVPAPLPASGLTPAHAPLWHLLAPHLARTASLGALIAAGSSPAQAQAAQITACAAALNALGSSLLPAAAPQQQRLAALAALVLPLDNTARWAGYILGHAQKRTVSAPAALPLLQGLSVLTASSCAHACGRRAACGHACSLTCHLTRADTLGAALAKAVAQSLSPGAADAADHTVEATGQLLLRAVARTPALHWLRPYLLAAGLHMQPAPARVAGVQIELVADGAPANEAAAAVEAAVAPAAGVEAELPQMRSLLCFSADTAADKAGVRVAATNVGVCLYQLHVEESRVSVALQHVAPDAVHTQPSPAQPTPVSPLAEEHAAIGEAIHDDLTSLLRELGADRDAAKDAEKDTEKAIAEDATKEAVQTDSTAVPDAVKEPVAVKSEEPAPAATQHSPRAPHPATPTAPSSLPVTVLPLVLFTDIPRALLARLPDALPACACAAACALPLLSFANALYPARCYACAAHLWGSLTSAGVSSALLASALVPHVHGATVALTFALNAVAAPLARSLGVTLDQTDLLEHPYSSLIMLPAQTAAPATTAASHAQLASAALALAGLAPAAAPMVLSLLSLLSSHYAAARVHAPTRVPTPLPAAPVPAAADVSVDAPPLPALAPAALPMSLCAASACASTLEKRCFCDRHTVSVPCASDTRADVAVLSAILLSHLKDAAEQAADGSDTLPSASAPSRAAAALSAALRAPTLAVPHSALLPLVLPAPALLPALLFSFATTTAPLLLAPPSAVTARSTPSHAQPLSALRLPAMLPLLPLGAVQSWLQSAPCVAECQQQMVVHRIARALNVNLTNKHQVALLAQHADLITRAHSVEDKSEQARALQGLQSAGLNVLPGVSDDGSVASAASASIANPALSLSPIDAFQQWQRKQQAGGLTPVPAAPAGLAGALTGSGGLVPYSAAFLETLIATRCDGFVPAVEHYCRLVLARQGNEHEGAAMALPPMNTAQRSIAHATAGVFNVDAKSLRAETTGLKPMQLALQPGAVEPVFPLSEALDLYKTTRQVVVVHVDRLGAYHDNRPQLRALAHRIKEEKEAERARLQREAAERKAREEAEAAAEADGWSVLAPSAAAAPSQQSQQQQQQTLDAWDATGSQGTDLTGLLREVTGATGPADAAAATAGKPAEAEVLPEWEAGAE